MIPIVVAVLQVWDNYLLQRKRRDIITANYLTINQSIIYWSGHWLSQIVFTKTEKLVPQVLQLAELSIGYGKLN